MEQPERGRREGEADREDDESLQLVPEPVWKALNDRFGLGVAWSQTVMFTILILLMVFKPEGILGKPTIEKV